MSDRPWPVETIPNEASMHLRVHKTLFTSPKLQPSIFRKKGGQGANLSCDWDKYATPEESRNQAPVPSDNAIVSLGVELIKKIKDLKVLHEPEEERNWRAHSGITGIPDSKPDVTAIRVKLLDSVLSIPIPLEIVAPPSGG